MICLLLALAMQTILWFVPEEDRLTLPALVAVESLPAAPAGHTCGLYGTDDRVTLAWSWPCLAVVNRTVLHEMGHRWCWLTLRDLSETCADAYAGRLLQ